VVSHAVAERWQMPDVFCLATSIRVFGGKRVESMRKYRGGRKGDEDVMSINLYMISLGDAIPLYSATGVHRKSREGRK
jgi:hypothetical protein